MGPTTRAISKMGRESPRYLLRLPQELRDHIQKEANLNGRSVNTEIVKRLQDSIDTQLGGRAKAYQADQPPATNYAAVRDDSERAMLAVFRRMSPEKQLALLSLFK